METQTHSQVCALFASVFALDCTLVCTSYLHGSCNEITGEVCASWNLWLLSYQGINALDLSLTDVHVEACYYLQV